MNLPTSRAILPEQSAIFGQILRFGLVGTVGFMVDTAVVYATRGLLGLYGAGALAFLVACTANWALNRRWTFRDRAAGAPARQQLPRYVAANLIGFVLNRGTYALVVTYSALAAAQPVLATAAGAVAGMGLNFLLSRSWCSVERVGLRAIPTLSRATRRSIGVATAGFATFVNLYTPQAFLSVLATIWASTRCAGHWRSPSRCWRSR